MALPATTQVHVDVLAHHDPPQDSWRPPHDRFDVRVRLLAGVALVTLMSAVALLLVPHDGRAGAVDASGSMVLEHHFSEWAPGPRRTSAADGNDQFSGPIRVDLPDRQLVGLARITLASTSTVADGRLWLVHQWGQVRATLGSATCRGPFAWTSYRRPRDTGGPLTLRCDDGSLLAATALVDGDENTADHAYRVFLRLKDGWYVPG